MLTIAVILNWHNQTNKSGSYPLHHRIGINDNNKYYNIDIPQKIKVAEWNGKGDAWVKQTHPFAFEINNKIIEKKTIITNLIKRCYSFNKAVTPEMVFQHLRRKGDINSFFD